MALHIEGTVTAASAAAPLLDIVVCFASAPSQMDISHLQLPAASTVADALQASGVLQRHPQAQGLPVGIWGRKQALDTVLRAGDRIEIYRALLCDPKEARRLRYRQRADRAAAQVKPAT